MPTASQLEESAILKSYVDNGDVVGICVSGGLDSKTVALRLRLAGVKVLCFTADIAQPDEDDINDVVTKMAPCGVETVIVDLKDTGVQRLWSLKLRCSVRARAHLVWLAPRLAWRRRCCGWAMWRSLAPSSPGSLGVP